MDPVLAVEPADAPVASAGEPPHARGFDPRLLVVALGVVLAWPLLIALVVLRHPRWYPLLDWAQTEIRVRDVASTHPPLIGLAGRIGPFGALGGSHPGPLSFYALFPAWALFGGASYGLTAGTVMLDIACIVLALWIAYRRGGLAMAVAIGLVLAVLMRAYGAFMLTTPWNPYLPVLWWFVFLLACWSVLLDDLPVLPVAVFAGTFCMQTHISYLGLIAGLGLMLAIVVGVRAYRRRGDAGERRRVFRWVLVAVLMLAVAWTPPVIDEVAHAHGNLTTIRDHFSNPPDPPIGAHEGVDVVLTQLNPVRLFQSPLIKDGDQQPVGGTRLPGVLLLLAWGASAIIAWRRRYRSLAMLDAVLAVGLGLGVISAARIFGDVWFYLVLWAWALTVLMLFAIGWTIVLAIGARLDARDSATWSRRGVAIMAAAIVVCSAVFAWSAHQVKVMSPRLNTQMAALTPPTVARLVELRRAGRNGPYYVSWLPEPQAIGAEGFGLLNELLRHGFDARADDIFRPGATRYHVSKDRVGTTLQVHLATGADIKRWQDDPQFEQVAYYDPRSDTERAKFDQLRAQVVDELNAAGQGDRVSDIDGNLFMLALSKDVAASTRKLMSQMLDMGLPAAVFIGPTTDPPEGT